MLKNKRSLGFTLTELVVTTAIMGTLAAVSIPSYIETQAKAKSEKTMSTISEMGQKLGQVYNELSGQYGGMVLLGTGDQNVASGVAIMSQSASDTLGMTYWGDIYAGGVPLSPFGDLPYEWSVVNAGSVVYTKMADGSIDIEVTQSRIKIWDQESDDLNMEFSY